MLNSDKSVCCAVITILHSLHKLGSGRECHSWSLRDQPFAYCKSFGFSSNFRTGPSTCTWLVFSCAWPREKEKKHWKDRGIKSLQKPNGTLQQQITSSKTLRWYSRATESRTTRLINGFGKANAVLHELYHSVVTKRDLSNTAKVSALKSVFVAISPMILSNDWKSAMSCTSSRKLISV